MKKLVSFLILLIYICQAFTVPGSADTYYYEDFSAYSEGDVPADLTCTSGGDSKLYITDAEVDGKAKNVLRLEHSSVINSVIKAVNSASYITASVRFRREASEAGSHPSFVLVARNAGSEVFRIYVSSNANRVVINSSLETIPLFLPSNPMEIYLADNEWNTFSIYVNTTTHKAGFKIETDALKDLTLVDNVNIKYDTKNGIAVGEDFDIDGDVESIDDIRIYTGGAYTGAFEIDYISTDTDDSPFTLIKEKPEPLPLPLTGSAEERLVPDVKNVVVNNAVCYYPSYPLVRDGKWYAEYKKTLESLGYTAFCGDGIITAAKDGSTVTLDYSSGVITIDGTEYEITKALVNNDVIMVPVCEICGLLGYNTRISDNTVYISEDELFGVEMSPYIYKGTMDDTDDTVYIFQFGTRDNKFEDAGIEINGRKYPAINFDGSTGTKFGIGISDPGNKLGDKYYVKPYYGSKYLNGFMINKNTD